jgi:hypothetical protein
MPKHDGKNTLALKTIFEKEEEEEEREGTGGAADQMVAGSGAVGSWRTV